MTRLTIRVIPNASKTEMIREAKTTRRVAPAWTIRIAAAPVDGRANEVLIEFLSERLDCSKSEIRIVKGFGSREKIIEVPNYISFE